MSSKGPYGDAEEVSPYEIVQAKPEASYGSAFNITKYLALQRFLHLEQK